MKYTFEVIDDSEKGRICAARWDDWGFFIDDIFQCFVWHFEWHIKIQLPSLRDYEDLLRMLCKCVVTRSIHEHEDLPEYEFCNVSSFFSNELYFLICRPPYREWEKVIFEDFGDGTLRDVVSYCNDQNICALFQNGELGMIQIIPQISTSLIPIRAPTDSTAQYRKRQLVSWQDQLYLVLQKLGSPSAMDVWKADFETEKFNRIFNLDGFNIFLGLEFSAAVSSSSLQDQNCIYFTEKNDDYTLYAFHIGDQSFIPHNSVPLLDRRAIATKQDNIIGDDKVKKQSSFVKNQHSNILEEPVDSNVCNHLSLDLQKEISRYLLSQDAYMNFRLVCKLWRSVAPPLRWKVVDHAAPFSDQDSMWLLSLNQKDGLCTFYNPFRNLNCYMSNDDLLGCEIRYAKDGWLLVSRGKSLFLLEPSPSSKQIIHLPRRTEDYFCDTLSFSATPANSSAWVIFGIACLNEYQVRISYLRAGDDNWTSMIMDNEVPFALSCSSPVYFGEEFCVIGDCTGDVGAFGFLEDGNPYWVIHQICPLYSPRISGAHRHFLVQRDQNVLYSVILTRERNVRVYELEFGEYESVKLVKEVKNWLLFISEASSVVVGGMNVGLDDALFFPSFNSSNDYIYYSLEADTFKVLKDNSTDKRHHKELLNRVWIRCEPATIS